MSDSEPGSLDALRAQLVGALAMLDALSASGAADPWMSADEAAHYSRCKKSTIERHGRLGTLKACRGERRRLLTRRSWIDAWLESRPYQFRDRQTDDEGDEDDDIKGILREA